MKNTNVITRHAFKFVAAAAIAATLGLSACTPVRPGVYDIEAYDQHGRLIHTAAVIVQGERSLAIPMNGTCIAFPDALVVARPRDGSPSIERHC
jgi:hypothetical protein